MMLQFLFDKPSCGTLARYQEKVRLAISVGFMLVCLGYSYYCLQQTLNSSSIGYAGRQLTFNCTKSLPLDDYDLFVTEFRHVLNSDNFTSSIFPRQHTMPFILKGRKLLCRSKHLEFIKQSVKGAISRPLAVFEMIQFGLNESSSHMNLAKDQEIPMILMNDDENGCQNTKQLDCMKFPRLTWSIPSPKHNGKHYVDDGHVDNSWCHAIGIPFRATWNAFHTKYKSASSWEATFKKQSHEYPWSNKINKVVWRGTTTWDKSYGWKLGNTPRGKLVQKSMLYPELIDAAFIKVAGKLEEDELLSQIVIQKRMPFDDQMNYLAVADVDGNNWSSRFPKLLCTNSVVIKIDPDYVEYFYQDLKPMVHYVPASFENVTEVAAYVLDKNNENEMKTIVNNANTWCKSTMTEEGMAKDAMRQLGKYQAAFQRYMGDKNFDATAMMLMSDDVTECV